MRKFVMAAALVAAVMAGAALAQERDVKALQGTWSFEVEKTMAAMKEMPDFKNASPEEQKQWEEGLRAYIATRTFVFTETTVTEKGEGEPDDVAEYKIVSHEGAKWTIETKGQPAEGEEPEEAEQQVIEWIDDDHIKMYEPPAAEGEPVMPAFLIRRR